MKICKVPFQQIHLDPNGGCRLCAWTDATVGNLLNEELEDIWNGEKANVLRKAIQSGDYSFCRKASCPFLENDSLPDLDDEEIAELTARTEMPKEFSVACDFTCNHSCPSCRDSVFVPDEEYKRNLDTIINKVMPALNKADSILTDGNGDCFSSPRIMEMLEKLRPENPNCIVKVETNGALFNEKCWERIKHLASYNIKFIVTPNSFEPSTFRYLNGGHDTYDAVIHNLGFIRDLKRQGIVKEYAISIVVQDRNFFELPAFAKRCIEEFEVDRVTVKPLYRWFGLHQDDFWFKDVLNPSHPYHKEYMRVLKDPILENPKVYFWGAKNLHKDRPHPAYIYKEHMALAARLIENADAPQKLGNYLKKLEAASVYIYGDMDLGTVLSPILLKSKLDFKGVVARDICRKTCYGKPIIPLCDYKPNSNDIFLILNYDFMETIQRDLCFKGVTGKLLSAKEVIAQALEEE